MNGKAWGHAPGQGGSGCKKAGVLTVVVVCCCLLLGECGLTAPARLGTRGVPMGHATPCFSSPCVSLGLWRSSHMTACTTPFQAQSSRSLPQPHLFQPLARPGQVRPAHGQAAHVAKLEGRPETGDSN
jgi:hypothetical protein